MRFIFDWLIIIILAAAFISGLYGIMRVIADRSPLPTVDISIPTAAATASPTVTPTITAAATPVPATATQKPPAPTQEPEPVITVGGGNSMALPVPVDTSIVFGGCASDGTCYWYNFYWAPTQEVVMQYGEGVIKVQHERCHAHQHWSINGGAPLPPFDYDLESWYETTEAQSFVAASVGLTWPWTDSAISGLEDFAWTCAYWYLDAAYLLRVSPERYAWARKNLP